MKRSLTPLLSIGVAYVGFLAGALVLSLARGPIYEPTDDLWTAGTSFAWAVLAGASVAVSLTSLVRMFDRLRWWLRIATIALNVVVLPVAWGALQLSIWTYEEYAAGRAAFEAAVAMCGQRPVLADESFTHIKTYILPTDPDYDRLKYTTWRHFNIFDKPIFICTEADAVSQGYQRQNPP